jgi:hypothetical protein
VMLMQEGNETGISTDSSNPACIIVTGSQADFQSVSDRVKYAIIGEK